MPLPEVECRDRRATVTTSAQPAVDGQPSNCAAPATSGPAAGSGCWSRGRERCVNCGSPERTSLHTGALLSGWTNLRAACCCAASALHPGAGGRRVAVDRLRMRAPHASKTGAVRRRRRRRVRSARMTGPRSVVAVSVRLYSFWSAGTRVESRFPIAPVAGVRRARYGGRVGLALIRALLVVDDLRTLAAARRAPAGTVPPRTMPCACAFTICVPRQAARRGAALP